MTFPDRRGIGRDNRDSWAQHRENARSRNIRNSSLSPGEAGLGILDAAGNPIYKVGEEGGKRGLLVRVVGAGWRTVDEDAQAKVDWLNGVATQRFQAVEGRVSTAENRIATEAGRNDLQWDVIDNHSGRLGTAESDIATERGRNDAQWNSIDNHTGRIQNMETRLNQTAAYFNVIRTWMTAMSNAVSAMGGSPPAPPNPPPWV